MQRGSRWVFLLLILSLSVPSSSLLASATSWSGPAPVAAPQASPMPATPAPVSGVVQSATAAGTVWTNLTNPYATPSSESATASAYDPTTGYLLLFGGGLVNGNGSSTVLTNATWELSPTGAWTELHPAHSPPMRAGAAMVYLPPPDNEFVLFAGANLTQPFGDTWAFNVTSEDWTLLPTPVHPTARVLPAVAQLPGQDGFYIFGGANATGNLGSISSNEYYSDLWYFSPSSGWKNETPVNSPAGRIATMMSYSGENNTLLLAGGIGKVNKQTIAYYDSWLFSTVSDNWTEVTNKTSGTTTFPTTTPALGCGYYDPINGRVDYVGGSGLLGSGNSTWDWSPVQGWQPSPSVDPPPPPLSATSCAWDSALHGAILFGGLDLNIFGNPRFTVWDSTNLVRFVGWDLSVSSPSVLVAGTSFNLTASVANGAGPEGRLTLDLGLNDTGGTITPKSVALVNGTGTATVTVWRPDSSDVISACQWGLCVNLTANIRAPPSGLELVLPTSAEAGSPVNLSLLVVNRTGVPTPWWNGTASIGTFPGTSLTRLTVVNGAGRLSLTLFRATNYTVFATALGLGSAYGNVTILPGPLSVLHVAFSSTTVSPGGKVTLEISASDAYGNPVSVPSLNVTDSLQDFRPFQATVPSTGTLNESLQVGNATGNDTVTVSAEGVQGSAVLTIPSAPVVHHNSPAPSPYANWVYYVVLGVAIAALVVALFYFRRRKEQKKKEKKERSPAPAYLGFLPFKEEEQDGEGDR